MGSGRGSQRVPAILAVAMLAVIGASTAAAADDAPADAVACGGATPYRYAAPAADRSRSHPRGPRPRFREVSRTVGLTAPVAPLCGAPHCLLSEPELRAEFPTAALPKGDALNGALCQLQRFTGGVAVGDADGDGHDDLYVTRLDGPGRLFRSVHGRYVDVTAAAGLDALPEASVGAAWADIDNDGDEDLFVSTIAASRYYLFVNDGTGRFTEEAQARGTALDNGAIHIGYSVAVGDYDRDGYADVYFTEYRGSSGATPIASSDARLLHNRGAAAPGHFEDVTVPAHVSIEKTNDPVFAFAASFADLDRDGWQDLFVTGDFGTSHVFWNRGDGTFVDGTKASGLGTEENGMGTAVGDVDGDGRPDLMVTSIFDSRGASVTKGGNWGATGNRLYRNLGDRRFEDVTDLAGVRNGGWGWGAGFVDAMNRGRRDVIQLSGVDFPDVPLAKPFAGGRPRLWRNEGDGGFTDIAGASGFDAVNGRGLAVVDQNADGRLDLVAAQSGTRARLYRNTTPHAGHWIRIRVQGRRSNRDALGAVVTVRPRRGHRPVVTEVGTGTAFLGQSERTVHVGLGTRGGKVARVEVYFPASGARVVRTNVPPDRNIEITEPRQAS